VHKAAGIGLKYLYLSYGISSSWGSYETLTEALTKETNSADKPSLWQLD
jgi:hypothetical protein